MSLTYHLSEKARDDYVSIYAYTYETYGENQAETYTSKLLDALERITIHPEIGRKMDEIRVDYFRYSVEKHNIYYQVQGDAVIIIRILAQRQRQIV